MNNPVFIRRRGCWWRWGDLTIRERQVFLSGLRHKKNLSSLSLSLSLSLFVCVCVSRARKHTHTHTHTHTHSQWLVAVAESNLETQTRDAKTRAHAVIFSSAYSRHSARLTVPAETALRFLHQRVFFFLLSLFFLLSFLPISYLLYEFSRGDKQRGPLGWNRANADA